MKKNRIKLAHLNKVVKRVYKSLLKLKYRIKSTKGATHWKNGRETKNN